MTIGDRIRAIRKGKGLTQKELAKKLGVSASMIGQYETNVRNPKFETIQKIASSLGVTTAEIIDLSPISPSLNSMYTLMEEVNNSICAKQENSDGSIPLSDSERQKLKKAAELYTHIPEELSKSSYFNDIMRMVCIGLFEKLDYQGKRIAIDMLQNLADDPSYKAE